MSTTVIPLSEFSDEMQEKWRKFQASNPIFSGPCFAPELFMALGKHFNDIYVAILHNEKEISGFLPFLKDQRLSIAKPIPMCDYQMIIGPASYRWDIKRILKEAGLAAWSFNSLIDFRSIDSEEDRFKIHDSPRVDLTGGFEAYLSSGVFSAKAVSGKRILKHGNINFNSLMNQRRRIERDIGQIRFVPICSDEEILRRILAWKEHRHNKGRPYPVWIMEILDYLRNVQKESFSGVLSALYAGDELIAAHFGLRSRGILYYWFPAINPEFSKYTPGLILLYHLISELDILKCKILDFGPGEEKYKSFFSNSSLPCMSGSIKVKSALISARQFQSRLRGKIESTKWLYYGLRPIVRGTKKIIKSISMPGYKKENMVRPQLLNGERKIDRLKAPLGRRILVIAPHPDDESIGAGGLLLAHRKISEIYIVNVFNGEAGGQLDNKPWSDTPAYKRELVLTRRKELESVSSILGAASIQYLDFRDGQSISRMEYANKLKQIVDAINPDVVVIPWYLDNNRDHRSANILYSWACSGVECMVLGCEIWSLCQPNAVFDISEYLEEKTSLIGMYKTQNSYIDYANYARSLAVVRGFLHNGRQDKRCAYEAFFALPNREYCDLVQSFYGRPGRLKSAARSSL